MSAITVRIPDALFNDLNKVAKLQDRPKSRIIKKALENYLLNILEDLEDIRDAEAAISRIEAGGKTYSWEDVQKE